MSTIALISGITGQDGSYLSELLLEKNYIVWGMIRKTTADRMQNINHLLDNKNLILRYGDLTEGTSICNILSEIKSTYVDLKVLEIYNLGALTHVKLSFELPEYVTNVNALGVLRFLEAIRLSGFPEKIRFYQASTSEMMGKVTEVPQTETTPFYPRSPYGVAKLYGYWIVKNYRESYNLFACNGILFNHTSIKRDESFVCRKITKGLAKIISGTSENLVLGNIHSQRDFGAAKDYVRGMWLMLQQDTPDDFILCSGETHSIKELVEKAFGMKGFDIQWKGAGINEIGFDSITGKELIVISEKFYRPAEVDLLLGDCTKAKTILNWQPECTFDQLIKEMVEYDCQ
jgi:GDPmannose 4,6-dehydratase